MKVGVGICTYNRSSYFKQCFTAAIDKLKDVVDVWCVYEDGSDKDIKEYDEIFTWIEKEYPFVKIFRPRANGGVAKAKNTLLKHMMDENCDYLFLLEDDIIVKDEKAVTGYIKSAEQSGFTHLCFAYHGPMNKEPMYKDQWLEYHGACIGAWCMYTKEIIEKVGYLDENFKNAWEHCLGGNTNILTKNGWKNISDISGTNQILLSKGGQWINSEIKSFGVQDTVILNLKYKKSKKTIITTKDHIWILKSGKEKITSKLKKKDILKTVYGYGLSDKVKISPIGIQHGICVGDGYNDRGNVKLSLYKHKAELIKYFPNFISKPTHHEGFKISGFPKSFKQLPSIDESNEYLLGFLCGYTATDGSLSKGKVTITSVKKENVDFVRDICGILGVRCGEVKKYISKTSYVGPTTYYSISFSAERLGKEFFINPHHKLEDKVYKPVNWEVVSITEGVKQEVFCAIVPNKKSFVIEGNILTHNCEYTKRIGDQGFCPPFGLFIDAAGSKDWLEEIPGSIDYSAIRPRDDWQKNIDEGLEYWKKKDGVGLPKL